MDSMRWSEPISAHDDGGPPTIKNHSVTHFGGNLYCFGGYDGRRNHMTLLIYSIAEQRWKEGQVEGTPPNGRNGHTATLTVDMEDQGRIIIIGGWLGMGPLAASDLHVLELPSLTWHQPTVSGTQPGPCNMHSADFIPHQREVYVFRGGNGREYLNDLHALDVDTFTWRKVATTGPSPQQRANHSSAYLEETAELFIFGGWNGRKRLNDIHILDTTTSSWTCPHIGGVLPHPRAGMTLTALRGRLFLFGGSGTSSKCFQDLQILDRHEMAWLDVEQQESYRENQNNQRNHGDNNNNIMMAARRPLDWRRSSLASPNPNDEETVPTVTVQGNGPGKRAGHTATAVNRSLYVFGGSCGSDYLNDFFVLDTDPPPLLLLNEPSSLQLVQGRLWHFFNEEEMSDVTFLVEGHKVYGHKLILSIVSDCFRAMFTAGFRESTENKAEIEIPGASYEVFMAMMEYVYTGRLSKKLEDLQEESSFDRIVDLMELADQYFLDHLKQKCEILLQPHVNNETVEYISQAAQKTNSLQLLAVCEHFQRNLDDT